jgi:hypothetical protein
VRYGKYAHSGVGMPVNVGESGRGLTILVVDDHDSVRLLLAKALRRRGLTSRKRTAAWRRWPFSPQLRRNSTWH